MRENNPKVGLWMSQSGSPRLAPYQILILATTTVTLPVLELSIDFLLALIISKAILVALIGRVSLDVKLMPGGLSNLKHFSTCVLGLLYPLEWV